MLFRVSSSSRAVLHFFCDVPHVSRVRRSHVLKDVFGPNVLVVSYFGLVLLQGTFFVRHGSDTFRIYGHAQGYRCLAIGLGDVEVPICSGFLTL